MLTADYRSSSGCSQGHAGFGDALEKLEAARIGEGFEDGGAAGAGETGGFGAGLCGIVGLGWWHRLALVVRSNGNAGEGGLQAIGRSTLAPEKLSEKGAGAASQ